MSYDHIPSQISSVNFFLIEISPVSSESLTEKEKCELYDAVQSVEFCIEIGKPFNITLSGYDEDPREVYEIPEARNAILALWKMLGSTFDRLTARDAFVALAMSNFATLVVCCQISCGSRKGRLINKGKSEGIFAIDQMFDDLLALVFWLHSTNGGGLVTFTSFDKAHVMWKKIASNAQYDNKTKKLVAVTL